MICAEQAEVVPEFVPAHDQFHGPVPVMAEAVQTEQRFDAGFTVTVVAFEEPQTPSIFFGAEHVAAMPPNCPVQVQSNDPSDATVSTSAFVQVAHHPADGYT